MQAVAQGTMPAVYLALDTLLDLPACALDACFWGSACRARARLELVDQGEQERGTVQPTNPTPQGSTHSLPFIVCHLFTGCKVFWGTPILDVSDEVLASLQAYSYIHPKTYIKSLRPGARPRL
jgi:hypothetical protein